MVLVLNFLGIQVDKVLVDNELECIAIYRPVSVVVRDDSVMRMLHRVE